MQIPKPYVYIVRDAQNGKQYIGMRCANTRHYADDLGVYYFTSSDVVSKLWKDNATQFVIGKVVEFSCKHEAYAYEGELLMAIPKEKRQDYYNRYFGANSYIMDDKTRAKISTHQRGKVLTDDHKDKISKAKMGHVVSEATLLKMSNATKGRVVSEETKRKISKGNSGKVRTAEHCANLSNSLRGRKYTDEQRQTISERQKGKTLTAEHKAKISEGCKKSLAVKQHIAELAKINTGHGRPIPEDVKRKISETLKRRYASPSMETATQL